MDETLETVEPENQENKLDILENNDDNIELKDNVTIMTPVNDNEVLALEAKIHDLLTLKEIIYTKGMTRNIALEADRICNHSPIIHDERPVNSFTALPTLNGLDYALECLDKKIDYLIDSR